jgi:hypothetical protein
MRRYRTQEVAGSSPASSIFSASRRVLPLREPGATIASP